MNWINRSFRTRILASILVTTMIPILLCNIGILRFLKWRSETNQEQTAHQQIGQCTEALTKLCDTGTLILDTIANDGVIRSTLRANKRDSRSAYQILARENARLNGLGQLDIYFPDGKCAYSAVSAEPAEDLEPYWDLLYAVQYEAGPVFRRCSDENIAFRTACAVRDENKTILGYVVLSFSWNDLDEIFRGIRGDSNGLFLLDQHWRSVYSTNPLHADENAARFRARIRGGQTDSDDFRDTVLSVKTEPTTGFYLVLQQPLIFTPRALNIFYSMSVALGVLCFGFCICCALVLSHNLAEPVNEMNRIMVRVEQGDFAARMEIGRRDELGRLAKSFNRMVSEYQTNLIRSVENLRELNAAQVRMMQAQLNPHFLYNTLDSMKWMALSHHVPQIAELATDLAALLRSAINAEEFFTLEQELDLVERYLNIQYIRFEDRFTCEIDVGEQFQHCRIPKLILQPIVENAIIHGVADQDDGYIKITAAQDGGDLVIFVRDNGCGIPKEIMQQLSSGFPRAMGKHLGLYNVNQILKMHYGSRYGITANTVPNEGSCVRLRMPMEPM